MHLLIMADYIERLGPGDYKCTTFLASENTQNFEPINSLKTFKTLPHRLQKIGIYNSIT